ncbi:MAG: hypothetical protein ABI199_07935 [Bacteroidia bacterium]
MKPFRFYFLSILFFLSLNSFGQQKIKFLLVPMANVLQPLQYLSIVTEKHPLININHLNEARFFANKEAFETYIYSLDSHEAIPSIDFDKFNCITICAETKVSTNPKWMGSFSRFNRKIIFLNFSNKGTSNMHAEYFSYILLQKGDTLPSKIYYSINYTYNQKTTPIIHDKNLPDSTGSSHSVSVITIRATHPTGPNNQALIFTDKKSFESYFNSTQPIPFIDFSQYNCVAFYFGGDAELGLRWTGKIYTKNNHPILFLRKFTASKSGFSSQILGYFFNYLLLPKGDAMPSEIHYFDYAVKK